MVTLRQRRVLSTSPASGRWWVGLLTALLFAFHVNYVRIHLLTEAHHSGTPAASAQTAVHPDDHDHHQHQPHPASDHQLQLAIKQHASLLLIAFLLPETSLTLTPPETQAVRLLCEHIGATGESPPDPRQPRAPPTV